MLRITGKTTRHLAAALVVAASVLAGCGGGDDDNNVTNPTQSSFSATLSGAVSGNYSGVAAYGTDGQGNFGLVLGSTTQNGISITFVRSSGGVPSAQDYSIADISAGANAGPGQFWVLVSVPGSSAQLLAGKSGTLKITSTSGNHLKGTFQFTAVTTGATPATASVSGSFDAVTGTVTIP